MEIGAGIGNVRRHMRWDLISGFSFGCAYTLYLYGQPGHARSIVGYTPDHAIVGQVVDASHMRIRSTASDLVHCRYRAPRGVPRACVQWCIVGEGGQAGGVWQRRGVVVSFVLLASAEQ